MTGPGRDEPDSDADVASSRNCTQVGPWHCNLLLSMRSDVHSSAPGHAAVQRRSRASRASAFTRVTRQRRRRLPRLASVWGVQLREGVAQSPVQALENIADSVHSTKQPVHASVAKERSQKRARRSVCCTCSRCGAHRCVCLLAVGLHHCQSREWKPHSQVWRSARERRSPRQRERRAARTLVRLARAVAHGLLDPLASVAQLASLVVRLHAALHGLTAARPARPAALDCAAVTARRLGHCARRAKEG